jgi:predicted PurR-regulated permease PerM
MRCVDSELADRHPRRDSPATVPPELRSGHTYERRWNTLRVAKGAGPTPIVISRLALGLLLLAALPALALLVVVAPGVILVASGGLVLALVLSFPVRALSRLMPRPLAVAATFLVLISSAILALVVLVPLLSDQLRILLGTGPTAIENASLILRDLLGSLAELGLLSGTPNEALNQVEGYVLERLQGLVGGLLGGLGAFLSGAFDLGVGLFGVMVVAAYLLLDERKFKAAYLKAIPARRRRDARELWDAFGHSFSRYLSGLVLVMAIQGALSGVGLWLLGVPYAALFGAWVALTAIVPYVGAVVGAIPALIMALLVSPATALATAVLFLAIQALEGNVLTPRIQGTAINVHPILVLLAVIGGGQVAGIAGAVFAVPVLAAVKVLYDFLCPRLRVERRAEFGANALSQHPRHEMTVPRPKSRSEEVRA